MMRTSIPLGLGVCLLWPHSGLAQSPTLTGRVANTTLKLPTTPPVFGYYVTNAFGTLRFTDPVAIVSPPGETNRLFVVEQRGRIAVITNLLAPTRTVFLDISSRVVGGSPTDERGLLGLAFHPGYATNRRFFVYYSLNTTTEAGSGLHQRLAEYQADPANPNRALPTEQPILTMRDEASNHNGGDLQFGPDGYLYVALGDEGQANDTLNNSQTITKDFWAAILRIDVDKRPGNLPPNPHPAIYPDTYLVPADNPFVGATEFNGQPVDPSQVRTEFWAVGLRNPWRISFDPETGVLYCGDVGQGRWEEIDVIVRGGNYGWAYREGAHPGPKTPPPGFTSIDPIQEYGHGSGPEQGNSVTGGVVYRGHRIPSLHGAYVFADYVSGNVWMLRYAVSNGAPQVTPFERLTTQATIAGFGVDPSNGDVLMAVQNEDTIKRLAYGMVGGDPLPPTLADTGAFSDLATLTPEPGIIPYEVNVPFWSDGAIKQRWFCIPNPNGRIFFREDRPWSFPPGTVWIKHFELELTNGVPASRRRLETRFLVRDNTSIGVYGITYRWEPDGTSALLVPDEGLDEPLVLDDGGVTRTQVWHYPARNECLSCHTVVGGRALGFNTPQLNRDFDYGGGVENQIQALDRAGYFSRPVTNINRLIRLARLDEEAWSREYRVRSYLMANCAHCHQSGGSGLGLFNATIFRPLSQLNLINGPLLEDEGDPANRVVAPGDPAHSMVLTRMQATGHLRMPPIGSRVVDTQAVALFEQWIREDLAEYESLTEWQTRHFGSPEVPEADRNADPDKDGGVNELEYLVGTDPLNFNSFWAIAVRRDHDQVRILFQRPANRGVEVQWTDDLTPPVEWNFLNRKDNRPFFAGAAEQAAVSDSLTNGPSRFYRVRVYEP